MGIEKPLTNAPEPSTTPWKCDTCNGLYAEYFNWCPDCRERGVKSGLIYEGISNPQRDIEKPITTTRCRNCHGIAWHAGKPCPQCGGSGLQAAERVQPEPAPEPRTGKMSTEKNVWRPIETAPRTGEHILAARFTGDGVGFGLCGGKLQSLFAVVHWWDNPGEEGWYPSFGPDKAFHFTHWQPLLEYAEVVSG